MYTTLKSNAVALWADLRWLGAKLAAKIFAPIKADMRAEMVQTTVYTSTEVCKLLDKLMELTQSQNERHHLRLTEIEKRLGIPTVDDALASPPISEQNRRLIDAMLGRSTPPAAPLGFGSLAPPKDWAKK
jgi:hypothetical protein